MKGLVASELAQIGYTRVPSCSLPKLIRESSCRFTTNLTIPTNTAKIILQ